MRTCLIRKVAIDVHLPNEEAGSNRRPRGAGLRANRSLHCRAVHVDASVVHLVRGPESAELIAEFAESELEHDGDAEAFGARWDGELLPRLRGRWAVGLPVVWNMECGDGQARPTFLIRRIPDKAGS